MYFFSREDLFADKFSKFIQYADNFKLIPILISEIDFNSVFEHDLFFTGEGESNKQFFLKKKTVVSTKIMNLATKKGLHHLYLKQEDENDFFGKNKKFTKTLELLKLRFELQEILLKIIDDSGRNSQTNGKLLLEKTINLSNKIEKIVKKCKNLEEAFKVLPLPRHNLTNQSLNLAIYASIMSNQVLRKKDLDLIIAAMFSNIGSVDWEFSLNDNDYLGLREEKAMAYKLDILRSKSLLRAQKMMEYIIRENENIIGTGFPSGEILPYDELEFQLLRLCKMIQQKREIMNGDFEKITTKVFEEILLKSTKINPHLLEKVKDLFG